MIFLRLVDGSQKQSIQKQIIRYWWWARGFRLDMVGGKCGQHSMISHHGALIDAGIQIMQMYTHLAGNCTIN